MDRDDKELKYKRFKIRRGGVVRVRDVQIVIDPEDGAVIVGAPEHVPISGLIPLPTCRRQRRRRRIR